MTAIEKYPVYSLVHQWFRYHYGSANRCESNSCSGKSKRFEWALIKGKKYEKKRENFMMMCRSCHRKYDITDAFRKHMATQIIKNFKKTNTPEFYKGMSLKLRGINHHTKEFIKKMSKPINQLTLDGKFVRRWDSIMDADRSGYRLSGISKCCKGIYKNHAGYKWNWADKITNPIKEND